MSLYREQGVNPLSGCLPLLIQLPFLIGMLDLLKSTFVLRGASFIPTCQAASATPPIPLRHNRQWRREFRKGEIIRHFHLTWPEFAVY